MASKFGYQEISDTLGDLVEAIGPNGIREAFEGGFSLTTFLLKSASTYPTLKEVYDDFGTFWQEVRDLDSGEALNVIGDLKARFQSPDNVQAKAIEFLENAALTYDYAADDVIRKGKLLIDRWAETF